MTDTRVQSVRNAWINRLRAEALRMRRPEVSKAVNVGVWIGTYADADGSNSHPSNETLAAIAGCSEETVTRCVRLLMAVGLLRRRRRPNASSMYQLVIPVERPDWLAHMDVWGTSRQAKARKRKKAAEMAELLAERGDRNPSPDAVRNPSPVKVPEPVPGGVPEEGGTRPRTGAEPVPGRGPEPVPGGAYQYPPTSGRDPHLDQKTAGHLHQPPTARARNQKDDRHANTPSGAGQGRQPPLLMSVPTAQPEPDQTPAADPGWAPCEACGDPMMRRPGRTSVHAHCAEQRHAGTA